MKARNGFVSNSSSSSFCIYGATADSHELLKSLNVESELLRSYIESALRQAGCEDQVTDENVKLLVEEYEICDLDLYELEEILDLEVYWPDGDYVYIGRSWDTIGDDETGRQFKKNVEDTFAKVFTHKFELSSLAETYYC